MRLPDEGLPDVALDFAVTPKDAEVVFDGPLLDGQLPDGALPDVAMPDAGPLDRVPRPFERRPMGWSRPK